MFLRARIGFFVTFAITAWLLSSGASTLPLGIGAQDEAVYSHAAIRMAESGDWSTPMFMGRFFLYKPPLIYWLSGASAKSFGVSARALRLPSILAASVTAGLVVAWVVAEAAWWRALLAAIALVVCPLFLDLGKRNMTDAIIMAAIVACAWLLAHRKPIETLAACIGIGILCKSIAGLIPILIAGGWWLAAEERPPLKRFFLAAGMGLLIASPWFLYQWEAHRRWFEAEFIGVELLAYGASAPPQTSVEFAPTFYAVRLWETSRALCVMFLLALPALAAALRKRQSPGALALGFAIAVMTAAMLGYQYRNATYLLPLLPLLAVAGAVYAPAWGLILASILLLWTPKQASQPVDGLQVVHLAEEYCEMNRGNELIVIGIPDDFSISTLPLAKLRYAIQGAAADASQITLDFRRMGIVLPVAEFNGQAKAQYASELRNWGLPNNDALGSVIGWDRPEELAELVRVHEESDFLFGPAIAPPSAESHRTLTDHGARLLLSHHTIPPAKPRRRACRL